jgi:hypothetical protein
MKKRIYGAVCSVMLLALCGAGVRAQEIGETETIDRGQIRFARGATSTIVRGNLRRGVRDQYLIRARPGQVMTVRFESPDSLMGFDVYVTEGLGAEPVTEADKLQREWSGRLPRGDEYYLNVMTAGGGAAYSFEISIGAARPSQPAQPTASSSSLPAREFRSELAKVRRQTRVPILLPDALPTRWTVPSTSRPGASRTLTASRWPRYRAAAGPMPAGSATSREARAEPWPRSLRPFSWPMASSAATSL